ncbi:DUF5412 family protein [Lysinibacillus sp. NPDC097195]
MYWNYRESTAKNNWLDNETVVNNGRNLEGTNEKFDFRNQ